MNLIKSTGTFSFFTIISRILGYLRDILIAIFLGTGMLADAFFVAFRIPNTFRRLFSEGTFNAAFVPSYASELSNGKEESENMAEEAFEIYFKGRNAVTFYEGVIETLELLKNDYSLGVVTNGNADLKVIGIDKLFDYIFSAADLNAHKPDPVMFEAVIKKTGLDAKEICHIGDHPINDVKASLDFGMTPIWFNNEKIDFPLEGIEVNEFSDWHSLPDLIKKL